MQLTHSYSVPAPIEVAWSTFTDLRQVGECFPGATVTDVSGDSFTGQVKVKLGPIAMVYTGTGHFAERDDASHHAVIKAEGKDRRGNGTAGATATIQLSSEGQESTKVDVTTDLLVTGKPAQFGRGVMQDVSDKLLGRFVDCIEGKLAADGAGPSAQEGGPPRSPAPTAASTTTPKPDPGAPSQGGGGTGAPGSGGPVGTAAMFGATAGADSWESRFGSGNGSAAGPGSAASVSSVSSGEAPSPVRPVRDSPASASDDDHIDLGATMVSVLPGLFKGHGREIGAGLVGFLIGWKLARFLPG